MKATGIICRIDGLGRVVIPKEIRKNMNIYEGDPLEVYIDTVENGIVFIPYAPITFTKRINNLIDDITLEMDFYDDDVRYEKAQQYLNKAIKELEGK